MNEVESAMDFSLLCTPSSQHTIHNMQRHGSFSGQTALIGQKDGAWIASMHIGHIINVQWAYFKVPRTKKMLVKNVIKNKVTILH